MYKMPPYFELVAFEAGRGAVACGLVAAELATGETLSAASDAAAATEIASASRRHPE
jgi:hypothetical protein